MIKQKILVGPEKKFRKKVTNKKSSQNFRCENEPVNNLIRSSAYFDSCVPTNYQFHEYEKGEKFLSIANIPQNQGNLVSFFFLISMKRYFQFYFHLNLKKIVAV